jgi:UDP-glucose 4-epimerase
VKQIVYLSTASVYGEVGYGLVDESCVPNPVHPDGMTHLGAEQLLASMVAAERWSVVILRLANVVGLPSAGGTFFKKTTLFSTLADVIAGGREQLEIFGVDWPTFDGTAVRDYVQLGDAVRAIVMALAKMPPMGEKTIYNIASGRGDSVRDVVRCFEKVSGKKIPVVELSARPGEIARSVIEPRKIQRELGWERRVNDLESLVRETCGLGKERLFGR